MLHRVVLSYVCLCSSVAALASQGLQDVKGSQDHPMISRVEGSIIVGFDLKEFDEYRLVKGVVTGHNADWIVAKNVEESLNDSNSIRLEGRVWKLTYDVPKNRSTLEIVRSYQTGLARAGFKILFECAKAECGGPPPKTPPKGPFDYQRQTQLEALTQLLMRRANFNTVGGHPEDQRYLAAQLSRPQGDVYVSILALGLDTPIARVDVIEVKPMNSDLVTVNAASMAADISTRGSVALYGIYFDTDRAEVKPDSRPTLSEIATLLKQKAKMVLVVVGHTDNNGTLEHNLDLSLRRAQAVVAALTSEFSVDRTRLEARGVGFLAPVASNANEEGRAKNRRVQLVPK